MKDDGSISEKALSCMEIFFKIMFWKEKSMKHDICQINNTVKQIKDMPKTLFYKFIIIMNSALQIGCSTNWFGLMKKSWDLLFKFSTRERDREIEREMAID